MVEVFKTNVHCPEESETILRKLFEHLPLCMISFDLEDCDKILRIEGERVSNLLVISLLTESGYSCEILT